MKTKNSGGDFEKNRPTSGGYYDTSLKSQIGDLKEEIKLIYQSTKRFLKDRISDFKAFKEVFKELADNISNISREKGLDSSFKKEFDRENKKKQTRGIR